MALSRRLHKMKVPHKAAIGVTFAICIAAAWFFQESANKDAFFLREFGVPSYEIQELKLVRDGGMMSSRNYRRFKCAKPLNLKNLTHFHAPYNTHWKSEYGLEFLDKFPEDADALTEKDQLECLEVSYKNSSSETTKRLLMNKSKNLYWYLVKESS